MAMATVTATGMANTDRPAVTLSYAQSLDGSIATRAGQPLALSGSEALRFTHRLRANHDAILVGINTVLADDPQLNVRLIEGSQPRPVILDSTLRCPLEARCLEVARRPIVVATDQASIGRQHDLETAGVSVIRLPFVSDNAAYIDLFALLDRLAREGIQSIMVEGGAHVITSFLRARLVDRVIITLAPVLIGGLRGVTELLSASDCFPRLRYVIVQPLGGDWIVSGVPDWDTLP